MGRFISRKLRSSPRVYWAPRRSSTRRKRNRSASRSSRYAAARARAAGPERIERVIDLRGIQPARLAGRETVQRERPDRPADEPQRRQADGGRHPANLPVPSLPDREPYPRRRNRLAVADRRISRPQPVGLVDALRARGKRRSVAEHDTAREPPDGLVAGLAFDLREVHLLRLPSRIGETRLQRTRIGQDEQALAVVVETSRRTHPRRIDVVRKARFAVAARELAQHAKRLVEEQHGGP